MKTIIFFCCASIALNSFAQLSDSTVQYKGGNRLLDITFIKNLHFNETKEDDSLGTNRFFFISFTIGKAGEINKINITSLGRMLDSAETINVLNVLKKTNGNWINHTNEEQIVVLPIYCLYANESFTHENPHNPPEIMQTYYINWEKQKLIYINPITVIVYQPIHDRHM